MTYLNVRIRMLLPILAALVLASPALGQTVEELKKENASLKAQIQALQKELDSSKKEVEKLEQIVAQLSSSSNTTPPPPQPEITIDETPQNSPGGLFNAIVESHEKAMKDVEAGTDRPRDRSRVAYMRALESWAASAQREFKTQIEWTVRIKDIQTRNNTTKATLIPVDPNSNAELGDPFEVTLDNPIMRRLTPAMERGEVDKLLLTGVVEPGIRINERRAERGPFDSPRFVAPYVEFDYRVDVRSLVPVEKKQPPAKRDADDRRPKREPGK